MQTLETPDQKRHRERTVLSLLFFATAINYLDRQTLSVIAPTLEHQISLTSLAYSRVVFAFLLGYTISQALVGRVIDHIGTRTGMLICVAVWSAVTMLHSLAGGVASFLVLRFLLGIAEAGNWPGSVKAVSENFTPERRAFAVGVFNSGSAIGAIFAPPLVALLVGLHGWRPMFATVGAIGFIWTLCWTRLYKGSTSPAWRASHPHSERGLPFHRFLKERAVWGFMISRFFADPTWWFYAFWLPGYLAQSRGFTLIQIGKIAWIPFVFTGVGGWLGGYASDVLVRRGWQPVVARKSVMVTSALLMLCGIPAYRAETGVGALAWISIVLLGYSSWGSNVLSLPADLYPSHEIAQVTGLAGTFAAIGGMLFTLFTGWLVHSFSYELVFVAVSGMILCAAAVIVFVVPRSRVPR